MTSRSRGEKIFNVFNIILLGVFALLATYPFLYTLSISFCSQAEASRNGLHIMPGNPAELGALVGDLMKGRYTPSSAPLSMADVDEAKMPVLIESIAQSPTDRVGAYLRKALPADIVAKAEAGAVGPEFAETLLDAINEHVLENRAERLFVRRGTSPFALEDFVDPAGLANALKTAKRPEMEFFVRSMTPDDRALLEAYSPPERAGRELVPANETPLEIREMLVRSFNRISEECGDIYEPDRFRFVAFPPYLKVMLNREIRGKDVVKRNRQVLRHGVAGRMLVKQDELRFESIPVFTMAKNISKQPVITDEQYRVMNRLLLKSAYPDVFTFEIGALGHLQEYLGGITLSSYRMVLEKKEVYIGYANTIFRTVVATVLVLLFTAIAAFPLSRKDLPHRSVIMFLLILTMLFSGGLIPTFLLVTNLGLYNSRWVYVIPGMLTAFNVILVKNFFQAIPESLHESARIDGASEWRILFQIYIPLSKPVLATVALWTAVAHWNEWFAPLIYIDDNSKQVLQFFLQKIVINNQTELISQGLADPDAVSFSSETIKAAMVMVTVLPILCVYPFIQKYFVKGIMLGSVKE